jgi:transposase InsO family protein
MALCDTCQRVKAKHQRLAGLLQPLKILEWKWEEIGMNFIVGSPCTQVGYDSIWVIVDHLTKVAHFTPMKTTYSSVKLVELYMSKIVCLHGAPKKIVSDRGSQFTSMFWEKLHEPMDTKLNFSSAYHLQTDGQIERTNQILEDMLRACASMRKIMIRACHMQNFYIIIVIKLVSKWHHLRHCMDDSVEHRCSRVRLERVKYLVQKYYRMLRNRFR